MQKRRKRSLNQEENIHHHHHHPMIQIQNPIQSQVIVNQAMKIDVVVVNEKREKNKIEKIVRSDEKKVINTRVNKKRHEVIVVGVININECIYEYAVHYLCILHM